jgi:copper chaperone CopZ
MQPLHVAVFFIHTNFIQMKTIKFFILSLFILSGSQLYAQNISSAELQVTGLTCSMCSKATETSLKTLDFIQEIKPDLNKNLFAITFKKDKNVNIDLIRKKVEEAGFSVGKLSATFHFKNATLDNNGRTAVNGNHYQIVGADQKVLNGPVKATVIDKNFIPGNTFKKNIAAIKSPAYVSGSTIIDGRKTRVYHLSI